MFADWNPQLPVAGWQSGSLAHSLTQPVSQMQLMMLVCSVCPVDPAAFQQLSMQV